MTEIYKDGVRVISERMPPLGPLPPYEDPTTLTRRDRFAMAALTAMISSPGYDLCPNYAVAAYRMADQMLAARGGK